MEDSFYDKHGISVEILHDPTLGSEPLVSTRTKAPLSNPKKKSDYVEELAQLLEVEVGSIDPRLTIKELQSLINEQKRKMGL